MRIALAFCLFAHPALAWEFTARPICTLSHAEDGASMAVTYNPAAEEPYAITVTGPALLPVEPVFSIDFAGPRALTISTDRHVVTGNTLTVTDHGFGNVLNGLEFNDTATASLNAAPLRFGLDGIAEPMAKFRACLTTPIA